MMLKSNTELFLKRIGDNLERLAEEIHDQNEILTSLTEEAEETKKLLSDIVRYPADLTRPPRLTIEYAESLLPDEEE